MKLLRHRRFIFFLAGLLFLWFAGSAWPDSGKGPVPAKQGPTADGAFRLGKTDRCPVCGMFPSRRPKHAAAMVLNDGRTFYFCSNGCLLRAWHLTAVHMGVSSDAIAQLMVLDYFSGAPADARKVWWVAGSDVIGPMGRAIVALRTPEEVEAFRSRHGGSAAFRLEQLDNSRFNLIFSIQ